MRVEDIQRNIMAAWRVMLGRDDGMKALDVSSDGFWDSFIAIPLCVPALAIGWLAYGNELAALPGSDGGRAGLLLGLALTDIAAWVLPLFGLALVARRAGIAHRFAHYVVATNWGSVILSALMLPSSLVRLAAPGSVETSSVLALLFFLASLALTWRLTTISIGKGAGIGTAVFAGMFVASLVVVLALQSLLGLVGPDQLPSG